jgi:maleate isomerase
MAAIDYGTRARVGVLLPSSNTTSEQQFHALSPRGVSFHITRLELLSTDESAVLAMADRAEEGATLLAQAGVDLIVFHCTAATTYYEGADDKIVERIQKATGVPATTTSKSVVAALRALQAQNVVLITPYPAHINAREVEFLKKHGFSVPHETGMGIENGFRMFDPTPEDWHRYTMENQREEADAYFISCAAIRATDVIGSLEADLGKPVITSNSAALWHSLQTVGATDPIPGFGTLLNPPNLH